eukprot:277283-Amphidinium_carterae.1
MSKLFSKVGKVHVDAPATTGSSGRKKQSGSAVSTELVASLWQEKFSISASTSWVRSFLHDLKL